MSGDDQDPDGFQTGYQVWEPLIWQALGVDKVEGLPEEPPPITNEDIKLASNYLRGTIEEGLADTSTGLDYVLAASTDASLAEHSCSQELEHGVSSSSQGGCASSIGGKARMRSGRGRSHWSFAFCLGLRPGVSER